MAKHPTIREIVEFGLDSIEADRTVEVRLRDLMFVFQTLGEWNRFFHQPMHYPTVNEVHDFLGSRDAGGAIDVLFEACYDKFSRMLPQDIHDRIDESVFEHPGWPKYYEPTQPTAPARKRSAKPRRR